MQAGTDPGRGPLALRRERAAHLPSSPGESSNRQSDPQDVGVKVYGVA